MSALNHRFLGYLDHRYATRDPRRHWVAAGLLVGIAAVAGALALTLAHDPIAAAPLFPLGIVLIGRALLAVARMHQGRRRLGRIRQTIRDGVPMSAYIVTAHDDLWRPGTEPRPCLALISFDPDVASDDGYMRYLARRLADRISSNEKVVSYRRRRLPESETDGSVVYCCDLWVTPGYLPSGYLTGGALACIAEPGESGGIELVPYWLLFPAIPEDVRPTASDEEQRAER